MESADGIPLPITVPAALYVEASTKIQGDSTHIIGTDSCGADNKPGIATTKPDTEPITFTPPSLLGTNVIGTQDNVSYSNTNMYVQSVVDSFKGSADFTHTVSNATHTGMNWGTPIPGMTQQDPSFCSCNNIVYYDTQGTDIKLSGGTSGCGILLVDGDLNMNGDFSWHGIVIVTGSVIFLGGGDRQKTVLCLYLTGKKRCKGLPFSALFFLPPAFGQRSIVFFF